MVLSDFLSSQKVDDSDPHEITLRHGYFNFFKCKEFPQYM